MPRPLKTKNICHTPAVKSMKKKKRIGASPAWLMNTHVHTNRYTTRFSLFLPLACTLCLANRFRCNSFLCIRKGRVGEGKAWQLPHGEHLLLQFKLRAFNWLTADSFVCRQTHSAIVCVCLYLCDCVCVGDILYCKNVGSSSCFAAREHKRY